MKIIYVCVCVGGVLFFLSIVCWLSEEVGFSYGVDS